MESITEPIERYAIYTTVSKLREDERGWWILVEGSWEFFYLGREKPILAPGDRIKITLEKTYGPPS